MGSSNFISDEERLRMEKKGIEEQKLKEALAEKQPEWKLFCYMGEENIGAQQYWMDMIQRQFDNCAGDEDDRWNTMQKQFTIEQRLDILEEYDGMNHDQAQQFVMQVSLPMLVRGHSIQTRILDDILSIRVPNLYRLTLGLPCSVLENSSSTYFDCKIRKLIIVLPIRRIEEVEEEIAEVPEPVKESRPPVSLPARADN